MRGANSKNTMKTTTREPLKTGDRIRLKSPTALGWKGIGTVSQDQSDGDGIVWFSRDGDDPSSIAFGKCAAMRHEVSKLRSKANDQAERQEERRQ